VSLSEEVCHVKNYHAVVRIDDAPVREGCGSLNNFPPLYGDSAKMNFLFDKTSEHVSTGHQDTVMLPHDEHHHSCCGDTSAVLECTTVDTGSGDGGSEHKNSSDEKDDETLYLVTGSKDTFSCDGSCSCPPTNDQVCSEVMLFFFFDFGGTPPTHSLLFITVLRTVPGPMNSANPLCTVPNLMNSTRPLCTVPGFYE
jgi:hypothetical protein